MSYLVIEDFKAGLDTRKSAFTTPPGALLRCNNAHIGRGAEIEKRKAFALHSDLSATPGTAGLVPAGGILYVFGSSDLDQPPEGVSYQKLAHPDDSSIALTAVLSADAFAGRVYVVAEFADGQVFHYYDGTRVTAWDAIAAGALSPEGVTRQFIAKMSGVPGLRAGLLDSAAVMDPQLYVTYSQADAPGGGAITTSIASNSATPPAFSQTEGIGTYTGPDGYSFYSATLTLSGDVSPGDVFTVTYTPDAGTPVTFTVHAGVGETGQFVRTFGDKIYCLVGSLLYFSGYSGTPPAPDPTVWPGADAPGTGFINMATQDAGASNLTSLAPYQGYLAVFSEAAIQIWSMDADPARNAQVQVLPNIGTAAPQSVLAYGDQDVFFLAPSGIRSLRARSLGNLAGVEDVGTPIDGQVLDFLATLTGAQRAAAVSVVEPTSGRYLLAVGSVIYVFSRFPGSGVAAWSTYEIGATIDAFAVTDRQVYARAGDQVYRYGGANGREYDASPVAIELPFLDVSTPATQKTLHGIDVGCAGTWDMRLMLDPARPEVSEGIGTLDGSTYGQQPAFAMQGTSTHFGLSFEHQAAGPAKLANIAIHYNPGDSG